MDQFSLDGPPDDEQNQTIPTDSSEYNFIPDIPYFEGSDEYKHQLDVWVPKQAESGKKLPVLMHIHGGGWKRGDRKTWFYGAPYIAEHIVEFEFVVVTVSYRLCCSFPEPIMDVANAFKWVYEHIEIYGGDPNKIFVSGHSAGGHLAALLATNPIYLKELGLSPALIRGCVGISGIYNVGSPLSPDVNCLSNRWYRNRYVEGAFGTDPAVWEHHSPLHHLLNSPYEVIAPALPPFLLLNATILADFGLQHDGTTFHDALKNLGHPTTYYLINDTHHQSVSTNPQTVERMIEFFKGILAPKK